MKKLLSKALAVVMAAALCVGMCATAFAAGTSADDTGSVTVKGLVEGVTASAYQIAEATYDGAGNFLGYEMTVSSDNTDWAIGNDGSWTDPTEADLAALFAAVTEGAAGTATADADGIATITDLPVGSYLIVIEGSESVIYGMMIGSVSYITEDGEWAIDSGEITDVDDCELWAKSITPTVEKTEHHTGDNPTHGETTSVGDEITFDITINNIPSYQGEYPEFEVDDQLTGLTISTTELSNLIVKIVDANGAQVGDNLKVDDDYTVAPVGDADDDGNYAEFEVNFVVNGNYTLNDYAGLDYSIVIEYQATVTDEGVNYESGEAEHDNHVLLTYSTTSYVDENEGYDDDDDYEYDFEIEFTKIDGTTTNALSGATFGLYTDSDCEIPYIQNGDVYTVTSDEDGKVEFTGLDAGTYYVKETEAPAGYLLNQNVYTVTIEATVNADGTLDEYTITISGLDYDSEENTISNTPVDSSGLPSTGGMGTTIFYIIGGVLVAGAVVVLVTRRRMSHEA